MSEPKNYCGNPHCNGPGAKYNVCGLCFNKPPLTPTRPTTLLEAELVIIGLVGDLRAFATFVMSRTKHGPGGTGAAGECAVDCVKCRAEAVLNKERP